MPWQDQQHSGLLQILPRLFTPSSAPSFLGVFQLTSSEPAQGPTATPQAPGIFTCHSSGLNLFYPAHRGVRYTLLVSGIQTSMCHTGHIPSLYSHTDRFLPLVTEEFLNCPFYCTPYYEYFLQVILQATTHSRSRDHA